MRFIYVIFLLSYTLFCKGQAAGLEVVQITTVDKQKIIGKLIKITEDSISIKNKFGEIVVLAKKNVDNFNDSSYLKNHNSSEPYYVPTAIPNGKDNHYYRNYALFGQNFSFGLNDRLDVSFGFELLSVFVNDESSWPIMQVGAKYSGRISNNTHIGFSTKVLFNNEGGGVLTSVPITFGGLRNNFTLAPTYSRGFGEDGGDLAMLFNFSIGLSDKVRLVTDALYVEESIVGSSLIEIRLKSEILLQPGIIFSSDFQIIPNFSFTIPFGAPKRKEK